MTVFHLNLHQFIHVPTYVKGCNTLDLVLSTDDDFVFNVSVCASPTPSLSLDHYFVSFALTASLI